MFQWEVLFVYIYICTIRTSLYTCTYIYLKPRNSKGKCLLPMESAEQTMCKDPAEKELNWKLNIKLKIACTRTSQGIETSSYTLKQCYWNWLHIFIFITSYPQEANVGILGRGVRFKIISYTSDIIRRSYCPKGKSLCSVNRRWLSLLQRDN